MYGPRPANGRLTVFAIGLETLTGLLRNGEKPPGFGASAAFSVIASPRRAMALRAMRTDLFDFDLPADRIALRPASPRDAARLLVVRPGGAPEFG